MKQHREEGQAKEDPVTSRRFKYRVLPGGRGLQIRRPCEDCHWKENEKGSIRICTSEKYPWKRNKRLSANKREDDDLSTGRGVSTVDL